MCGIAGALCFSGLQPNARQTVSSMMKSMMRRGPDGSGAFHDPFISLGHQRLALLDLSGGTQPFLNEEGSVVVIFNGEIYNHRKLRDALSQKGHRFRGRSDGEVISHLYEEHGDAFLQHLDGMFALAVYDQRQKRLLLARDRVGEKPLFVFQDRDTLYFSSTISALLKVRNSTPALSPEGLLGYFTHTQPAPPTSVFQGILKIEPGHYLVADPKEVHPTQAYWFLDYRKKLDLSLTEAIDRLDTVLQGAVTATLDSDYPFGITLSGGVDSSLVLAYMMEVSADNPPTCYTLGAKSTDEEFHRATQIASKFRLPINRFQVTSTTYDDMVRALRDFDEPVNVYDSIYLLQHSSEIAKRHRVAVTGNGADELFGGYDSYLDFVRFDELTSLPAANPRRWLEESLSSAIQQDAKKLYSADMADFARDYDVSQHLSAMHAIANYDCPIDARLCYDLFAGMSHCASLSDTVGMSFGLEYRSPFLHRSVIELSAALPVKWKVSHEEMTTKAILKKVAHRRLPTSNFIAPKLGCGQNIDRYMLMRTIWRHDIECALERNCDVISSYLDIGKVRRLWSMFQSGQCDQSDQRRTLKLVIFTAWLDAHAQLF